MFHGGHAKHTSRNGVDQFEDLFESATSGTDFERYSRVRLKRVR
jgi:hypothetical protein